MKRKEVYFDGVKKAGPFSRKNLWREGEGGREEEGGREGGASGKHLIV